MVNTKIEIPKMDITFADVENDLTLKQIYEIFNLDNDQDVLQVIKEEVKTLEVSMKKSIVAGYKQGFWLWKIVRHIFGRVIKLIYLKRWCKKCNFVEGKIFREKKIMLYFKEFIVRLTMMRGNMTNKKKKHTKSSVFPIWKVSWLNEISKLQSK